MNIATARHVGVGLLTMVLVFCLLPETAGALGFGVFSLNSHLNEPLQAEVSLLLSKSEQADQVRVELADQSEYKQMGLHWSAYLARVRVGKLKPQTNGASVRLYTTEPVHAPIVSILLKAVTKTGRGTYFRLYRFLLIDPTEMAPQAIQHPGVIELRADAHGPAISASSAAVNEGWARARRYGPVRSGESLGRIATRLRKDKRFSNSQVMLALYDKNKHAFVSGNMNELKQGAWLNVPDGAVVRSYAGDAAMQRLKTQLQRSTGTHELKRANDGRRDAVEAKTTQALQYSGKISLHGARSKQLIGPDSAPTAIKVNRLAPIYAELMAGKLQMTDLGESVSGLNKSVVLMQHDMQILKHDVATIRKRQQVAPGAEPSVRWSVVLYILLAGMTGLLVGAFIRRSRGDAGSESEAIPAAVEIDAPVENMTVAPAEYRQENDAPADDVIQLMNKVEGRLGRCDYAEAARLLDEVASSSPDSIRAAALRAQLYHETGRVEQRNALINQISESSDPDGWQRFCQLLPTHVWNACFSDGKPVESGTGPDKE